MPTIPIPYSNPQHSPLGHSTEWGFLLKHLGEVNSVLSGGHEVHPRLGKHPPQRPQSGSPHKYSSLYEIPHSSRVLAVVGIHSLQGYTNVTHGYHREYPFGVGAQALAYYASTGCPAT